MFVKVKYLVVTVTENSDQLLFCNPSYGLIIPL